VRGAGCVDGRGPPVNDPEGGGEKGVGHGETARRDPLVRAAVYPGRACAWAASGHCRRLTGVATSAGVAAEARPLGLAAVAREKREGEGVGEEGG
jgi:hypothetical protein